MQRMPTALRKLVNAGKFLELPTAYDAITGRLIQSVGFKSVYVGGFVTGGSTAISNSYEQLRKAGATARAMLVNAAAKAWKVPAAEITVKRMTLATDREPLGRWRFLVRGFNASIRWSANRLKAMAVFRAPTMQTRIANN